MAPPPDAPACPVWYDDLRRELVVSTLAQQWHTNDEAIVFCRQVQREVTRRLEGSVVTLPHGSPDEQARWRLEAGDIVAGLYQDGTIVHAIRDGKWRFRE